MDKENNYIYLQNASPLFSPQKITIKGILYIIYKMF